MPLFSFGFRENSAGIGLFFGLLISHGIYIQLFLFAQGSFYLSSLSAGVVLLLLGPSDASKIRILK
jgi:hypothetical protein